MSIVAELLSKPGVLAAGQYTYRGDRFTYQGALSAEQARMASIMCRTTTMATIMEGRMLGSFWPRCGVQPVRGWVVRGPGCTVCVMANCFCFIDNRSGALNEVLDYLRQALAGESLSLV